MYVFFIKHEYYFILMVYTDHVLLDTSGLFLHEALHLALPPQADGHLQPLLVITVVVGV